jgi:hypothetical protein
MDTPTRTAAASTTAALVLLIIVALVGAYFYFVPRDAHSRAPEGNAPTTVALTATHEEDVEEDDGYFDRAEGGSSFSNGATGGFGPPTFSRPSIVPSPACVLTLHDDA